MLKGSISNVGYHRIFFSIRGDRFKISLHRIIATKFIPNPGNKEQINHKDGNKLNNTVSNLEWCTQSENVKHAYDILGKKPNKTGTGKFGVKHARSKKLLQKSLDGSIVTICDCAADVKRQLGWSRGNICSCARGLLKSANGFRWEYFQTNSIS